MYYIVLFTNLDNLECAQRKIEKAKISDRLTSNDETIKKKKNCFRKKIMKKVRVPESSSSSDVSLSSNDSDDNTSIYPNEVNIEGNFIIL